MQSKLTALFALALLAPPAFAQEANSAVQRQIAKVRAGSAHGPFHADWNSLAAYRTPDWFQDAKFGIFLHWGVYSVPAFGNEWYSRNMYVPGNSAFKHQVETYGPQSKFGYKDFIPMFKAEKFNAADWVDLFAKAGARYVVPVAEHCDGFAMYDSQFTTWDAAQMGPPPRCARRARCSHASPRLALRGLIPPCRALVVVWPWPHLRLRRERSALRRTVWSPRRRCLCPAPPMKPKSLTRATSNSGLPPDRTFLEDWLARSTEIVDKYHPEFVYFDWWVGQPEFVPYLQQFAAYYYNRSEQAGEHPVLTYKIEAMPPNTATLDIERGKLDALRLLPWQTDTSVSIHSWGYVEHDEYRTAQSLVQQLVDTVSKNGNLLLNVGPKSDGDDTG